ncbi:hypothetical protein MMC15_005982 [Xylographa vitiligo]|nr:hypothetical protein [Xylographa vitiligo]
METVPSRTARIKSALRQLSGHDKPTSKRKDSSDRSIGNVLNVKTVSRQPTKIQSILHPSRSKETNDATRTNSSNRSIGNISSIKATPRDSTKPKTTSTPPSSGVHTLGDRRNTPRERTKRRKAAPDPSGNVEMPSVRPADTSSQNTRNSLSVDSIPSESTRTKGTQPPERKVVPAAVCKGPSRPRISRDTNVYKANHSYRRRLPVHHEAEEPNEAGVHVVSQGALRRRVGLEPSDEETWRRYAITAESFDALMHEDVDRAMEGAA